MPANSALVGGTSDVGNKTATGTVGHVKLSHGGCRVNVKLSGACLWTFSVIQSELCLYHADPPHYVTDLGVRRVLVMN